MSGAVKPVAKLIGLAKDNPASDAGKALSGMTPKVESKASRIDEEQGARMRGARRRGRSLLSDTRLNTESGMETLGGGNNLG